MRNEMARNRNRRFAGMDWVRVLPSCRLLTVVVDSCHGCMYAMRLGLERAA